MRKNLSEVVYQGKEKGSKCCIRNCGSGVCSRREGNKEKSRDLFEINAWKIFHKHPVKMFIGFWYLGSDNYTNRSTTTTTKSLQSCPTLCDPTDGSPPGSAFPGILQARTLEWVAISFTNAWTWSHSVVSDSSQSHRLRPTRLLHSWDFPGKSTGVGCHCLLHQQIRKYYKPWQWEIKKW